MPIDRVIPVALINEPPAPIRAEMDEVMLTDLAASIRIIGLINPLSVEETDCRFTVRAGHRRLLACRMIGLAEVPCRVYQPGEATDLQIKLHENAYREQVSPAEEGWMYKEMASQPGMTEAELARQCGQSIPYIYSRIKLVEGDTEIVLAVHRHEINLAVARELEKCSDEPHRRYLLRMAIDQGATANVAMSWVLQWKASQGLLPPPPPQSEQPAFTPTVQNEPVACAFCGQSTEQYNMVSVYIHRSELNAIRASLAAAEAGS